MSNLKFVFAGNITYNGITQTTKILAEYQHTGTQFFCGANHYTENEEIAEQWRNEGKNVTVKDGYYFIKRLAIPTLNAKLAIDWWYVTNEGHSYTLNKVSKYWQKKHAQLSQHQLIT